MNGELSAFMSWDRGAFEVINKVFTSGFFDLLMPLFSSMMFWVIPLAIVWLYFFVRSDRRGRMIALGCFLVVAASDQIAASVIKPIVNRERPCNVIGETHFYNDSTWVTTDKFVLTDYKSSPGFPSNHAANMAGQAMYWSYFYPHIAPVFLVAAFAVGYSRVYLGHHYPSDVLGGYLLGVLLALVIAYPMRLWILPEED